MKIIKEKKYPEPSTFQKWICPNCGETHLSYWGQCLKCGRQLNPIKKPKP